MNNKSLAPIGPPKESSLKHNNKRIKEYKTIMKIQKILYHIRDYCKPINKKIPTDIINIK